MCDLKHKLADLQYSLQQVTFESQEADNVKVVYVIAILVCVILYLER